MTEDDDRRKEAQRTCRQRRYVAIFVLCIYMLVGVRYYRKRVAAQKMPASTAHHENATSSRDESSFNETTHAQ